MTEEKIYTPVVISDQPFPGQPYEQNSDSSLTTTTSKDSTGLVTQKTVQQNNFPHKTIAHETIGSALNTKSKKILQEFEFTQSGAIQIGKYENGVSGEIKISPAGLVGKNTSGLITFAIDGETGNAVFAGELQTGALVTGNILIQDGGSIQIDDGNDTTYIDSQGLVSTAAIQTNSIASGIISQNFTTTNLVDVTGAATTFTITKSRLVTVNTLIFCYLTESVGNTGAGLVELVINGSSYGAVAFMDAGNDQMLSLGNTFTFFLDPGTYTIKLQGELFTIYAGAPTFTVYIFDFVTTLL